MQRKILLSSILAILLLPVVGCNGDDGTGPGTVDSKPLVCTTFYPMTYVVERLAGDLVDVVCPADSSSDPGRWKSSAESIARFQSADLIIFNGAGFEAWASHVSLPESRIVNTSRTFEGDLLDQGNSTHSHGPEGDHTHTGVDSHTWLDPILFQKQLAEVERALNELLPEYRAKISERRKKLDAELQDLHQRLANLTLPSCVLSSRPAYGYLARRYGWEVQVVELAPGRPLTSQEIIDVGHVLEHCATDTILWPSAPDELVVETLRRKFKLDSVVVRTGAVLTRREIATGADYLSVMRDNVARLETVASN